MIPSPESPAVKRTPPDLLGAAEEVLSASLEAPGGADGFRLHDALMELGRAIEAARSAGRESDELND